MRVPVFYILWLLPQEYQSMWLLATASTSRSYDCGFSRKSSSLLLWPPAVQVPVFQSDLSLCEFQSFNPTSRCASSSVSIWPLAVRVQVFQSDLSLCEFQSFNMTSCYASSSPLIWPLALQIPVSFFISPAGVFSPQTILLASPAGAMPAI